MKIQFLIIKKKILNKFSKFLKWINADFVIENFLNNEFLDIAERYKNFQAENLPESPARKIIWLFWWQGYENAPLLVKKCIDSVKVHSNGTEVVLLTEKSWREYADIPEYIIEKVESKKISLTHFSDILRMDLLSKHGGLWLDSTIFAAHDISEEWFSSSYFTIHYKTSTSKITKGRWTGFCQSAKKGSLIHSFCGDVFFDYWKKYDVLIDYFLIDYVMDFGYENIPSFKRLVDSVPFNNEGVKELDKHFNDVYSSELVSSILSKSTFFKLNWKREYKAEIDGKETIYKKFIEEKL